MSVRRLADESVQPQSFAFSDANANWAKQTIKKYPKGREQSAVIPLLMRAQEQEGWVSRAAIESIADMLGMAYIRVLEVATFYTQFQLKPVGTRAHVQVCGTTPCMLRGSEDLISLCKRKINDHPFETNADGTLSWEEVECQGACVNAPMVMIGKDAFEDLTVTQLEHIIDRFEAGRGGDVTPGPQNDRVFSAPEGGPTTLLSEGKPVKARAAEKPAAEKAASKAEGEKPSLDDKNRPAALEKPETPDDLKLISGVGPVLEGKLNDLGIFTYEQISKWKKAEIEWVDGYLSFKGRIDRDDWIKQAKALAKGGEAEYIKVFGKKPR